MLETQLKAKKKYFRRWWKVELKSVISWTQFLSAAIIRQVFLLIKIDFSVVIFNFINDLHFVLLLNVCALFHCKCQNVDLLSSFHIFVCVCRSQSIFGLDLVD